MNKTIASFEYEYIELVHKILKEGSQRRCRNGMTKAIFGEKLVLDMSDSNEFPLLHGRKMHYTGVLGEFAAMLRGPNNIADFKKFGCNYWDQFGDADGELNLDYGNAWVDFNGTDQLADVANLLKNDPFNRRILISGWRPDKLSELTLPCCHILYQWFVRGKHLDMIWYQRSVDTMIGLPSDIVLAAVWNILLANQTGYLPGKITFMLGDTHIYEEHFDNALLFIKSRKLIRSYPSYALVAKEGMPIENFTPEMISINGYNPQPAIQFELKV